jgi:hypothetical protein
MGSSPPASTAPHQVGHQAPRCFCPARKRAKFSHGPVRMAPRLSGADRANSLSTERSGFITSGLTTGQMARQIPTLAIGCPHVGARGCRRNNGEQGVGRLCPTRTIRLLARVLVKRFYLLFTCSLWGRYLEGRLQQVGAAAAAAAQRVPERPSRARRRHHIRYITGLAWITLVKRCAGPVRWAKRAADQEMAVALSSPEIMREP